MTVGICGLGMLGGSLALALAPKVKVIGFDLTPPEADERASEFEVARTFEDLFTCNAVFVATPISLVAQLVGRLLEGSSAIVSDCASVKQRIVDSVLRSNSSGLDRFVPGHPMAGNADSGFRAADPEIFHGSTWALCPTALTSSDAHRSVCALIKLTGAHMRPMSAEEHDQQVAISSHVPYLLATLLSSLALEQPSLLAGPTWRSFQRIAGSNPELWAEILCENQEAVQHVCQRLRVSLVQIEELASQGESSKIEALLRQGARS